MKEASIANKRNRKKSCLLPRVSGVNPSHHRLKVYFFGTPQFTVLSISKDHKIGQLISHIVALSDVDPCIDKCFTQDLPSQIRRDCKNPELYEMRFLEDEEDPNEPYRPLYGTKALDMQCQVGEFLVNSLAFCRTKEYEAMITLIEISNFHCNE